jgi:hypothetical protein
MKLKDAMSMLATCYVKQVEGAPIKYSEDRLNEAFTVAIAYLHELMKLVEKDRR